LDLRRLAVQVIRDRTLLRQGWKRERKVYRVPDVELLLRGPVFHDRNLVAADLRVEDVSEPLGAEARISSHDHHRGAVRALQLRGYNCRDSRCAHPNHDKVPARAATLP